MAEPEVQGPGREGVRGGVNEGVGTVSVPANSPQTTEAEEA